MRRRRSANGSLRTHAVLTAAGIPCTVVLDSAVSYIMDRVDIVLVGTEAVVESGVSIFPLRPLTVRYSRCVRPTYPLESQHR